MWLGCETEQNCFEFRILLNYPPVQSSPKKSGSINLLILIPKPAASSCLLNRSFGFVLYDYFVGGYYRPLTPLKFAQFVGCSTAAAATDELLGMKVMMGTGEHTFASVQ